MKATFILLLLLIMKKGIGLLSPSQPVLTTQQLIESAARNYPLLLYKDMDPLTDPRRREIDQLIKKYTNSSRRFTSYRWTHEIEDNPWQYHNFYRELQTFAYEMNHAPRYSGGIREKTRSCYFTIVTFVSAMPELRRYFELRILYVKDIEYEVGFLVHEIISKYQKMLEMFYLVRKKWFYHRHKTTGHVKYVLYMYTNILEISNVVIHLCNMLHELKARYKQIRKKAKYDNTTSHSSVFEDYHMGLASSGKNDSSNRHRSMQMVNKAVWEKQEKAKRDYQKYVRKHTPHPTKWARIKPYKSKWPKAYGWSIETW